MTPLTDPQAVLVRRTRELVAQIGEFLMANALADPSVMSTFDEAAMKRAVQRVRDMQELNVEYNARFSGSVIAVVDAFAEFGILPERKFPRVSRPVINSYGMQEDMLILQYLVERLELRDG